MILSFKIPIWPAIFYFLFPSRFLLHFISASGKESKGKGEKKRAGQMNEFWIVNRGGASLRLVFLPSPFASRSF